MSAVNIPVMTHPRPTVQPHLTVVVDQKEKFSMLLRARAAARAAWNRVSAAPRSAWAWMRSTLHLDAALEPVSGAAGWVTSKARAGYDVLGKRGVAALAVMALSTPRGRRLIDATVGAAARAIGRSTNWLIDKVVAGLEHLGAPGRWTADRVIDAHEFFVGTSTTPGLIAKIKARVAGAVALNTTGRRLTGAALNLAAFLMLGYLLNQVTFGSEFMSGAVSIGSLAGLRAAGTNVLHRGAEYALTPAADVTPAEAPVAEAAPVEVPEAETVVDNAEVIVDNAEAIVEAAEAAIAEMEVSLTAVATAVAAHERAKAALEESGAAIELAKEAVAREEAAAANADKAILDAMEAAEAAASTTEEEAAAEATEADVTPEQEAAEAVVVEAVDPEIVTAIVAQVIEAMGEQALEDEVVTEAAETVVEAPAPNRAGRREQAQHAKRTNRR